MFVYFPGYGIHFSTIDPRFLMKETLLSTYSWMEVKLIMKINQRLPRTDFQCKEIEYENISHLKKINLDYENCILKSFIENWSKRNRSCSPSILENYDSMYKSFLLLLLYFELILGHLQETFAILMRLVRSLELMMISIQQWHQAVCHFAVRKLRNLNSSKVIDPVLSGNL